MASRRTQILAASAIWFTVCGLGWHAYKNILPAYGFFRKSRPTPQQRQQEWKDLQKEQDDFFKEKPSTKLWIKVSEADPASRANISGSREQNGCFYYFAANQPLREAYCALARRERYQVSISPDTGTRYNIRVKTPVAQRKEVAAAFLKEIDYTSKEMASVLSGYRFTSGTPPAAPDLGPPAYRRGGDFPHIPLSQARGMVAGRVDAPVQVDKELRERMPQVEKPQVNWGFPPDKFLNLVANIYGVAVEKAAVETTSVLVYEPKTIPQADMQRWFKEGKL
jgi:hypothetical protein